MALALAASHLLVSAVLTLSHSVVSDSLWPIDCRPPGSSVHGVFQERILEWLAISFSRGSSQLRDWTCISCIDRWILHHWATWEASLCCSMKWIIYKYVCVCVYIPLGSGLGGRFSDLDSCHWWNFKIFIYCYWWRKWQPTPIFLPGKSQGQP